MATGIAALVCYAGVFEDVIDVEEMAARLGVSGQEEFYQALNELNCRGRLILKNGYAGLPNLAWKIDLKPQNAKVAAELIGSHMHSIQRLCRNPAVKFVGISGSLAANNPVHDKNNRVDVDVFVITRRQCLWLCVIPEKLKAHIPWRDRTQDVCMNYVMDETNLRVSNQNFYTATEIRNLIPVSGFEIFNQFLEANKWVNYYYPDTSRDTTTTLESHSSNWLNKIFFLAFIILRCIRLRRLAPLRNLSFKMDPLSGVHFNRLWHACGGYQPFVQKNFAQITATWFPDFIGVQLIKKLFPDEISSKIRKGEIDAFKLNAEAAIPYDYSKYA